MIGSLFPPFDLTSVNLWEYQIWHVVTVSALTHVFLICCICPFYCCPQCMNSAVTPFGTQKKSCELVKKYYMGELILKIFHDCSEYSLPVISCH